MSSVALIIIIVAVVVVLAVLVGTGLVLGRRRRISLTDRPVETPDEEKPPPRGGGYRAAGGLLLAPGGRAETDQADETGAEEDRSADRGADRGEEPPGAAGGDRPGTVTGTLPPPAAGATTNGVAPARPPAPPTAPPRVPPAPRTEPVTEPVAVPPEPPTDSLAIADVLAEQTKRTAAVDQIAPTAGRLERLRGRLARSRSTLGQGLLGLLGAGDLDEDSWTEIEDTLLLADLGAATTTEIVQMLRDGLAARGVRTPEQARAVLRDVLVSALHPNMDRAVRALPHDGGPAVVLVAGVNGTGKTTTTGKLARVLVADGRRVLLGAADTFRAAAADQLETWAQRVGAEVVRGPEGADPASVAFDAVRRGRVTAVDAVLIDTAGRLHTKTGLMDELGKVKRVVGKQAEIDEVLLVLDATTGQNGLMQARVFAEVVDVTGIVLTKLDGTAKGGIIFQVQRELGVPVKMVGLGEGPDDLAPFEPAAFVDALLAS